MRMKCYSKFFVGILSLGLLAGCSNDELTGNEPGSEWDGSTKDAVYMNVAIQLPVAGGSTRSETGENGGSSDGTEVGKDYENEVKRILLVLADKENKIIGTSYNENSDGSIVVEGQSLKSTQSISKSVLAAYYSKHGGETLTEGNDKINIYVFCNPTTKLVDEFKNEATRDNATWVNKVASIIETPSGVTEREGDGAAIWGGNTHESGFLMSTADFRDIKKSIPKTMKAWDNYNSPSSAFNLSGKNGTASSDDVIDNTGSIKVERAVARFDFKDGSNGNNTYDVVTGTLEGSDEVKTLVQIQLQKMALVNMSKEFYYLRRVSDNGFMGADATLCGTEVKNNYVVDTDADLKKGDLSNFTFGDHFNFCLGHGNGSTWTIDATARNQWKSEDINTVLGKEEDNWKEDNKYHIWRYVTENTIPASDGKDVQRNGISTGVVFKGKMIVTDAAKDTPLGQAIDNATGESDEDPILYLYEGKLYVTWRQVRESALNAKDDNPFFYRAVFGTPQNTPAVGTKTDAPDEITGAVYSDDETSADYWWGRWQDKNAYPNEENREDAKKEFKTKATTAQFTLYQSSKDDENNKGYFCYYYYWNRHNDNGNNGVMGPMEFAVVRNNVYKLAVTEIKKLGHPRISENDPDPLDPDDPDEKGDVYLTLSVEVLPWTVRVNNIEF